MAFSFQVARVLSTFFWPLRFLAPLFEMGKEGFVIEHVLLWCQNTLVAILRGLAVGTISFGVARTFSSVRCPVKLFFINLWGGRVWYAMPKICALGCVRAPRAPLSQAVFELTRHPPPRALW